jgi:hypothetical protein
MMVEVVLSNTWYTCTLLLRKMHGVSYGVIHQIAIE